MENVNNRFIRLHFAYGRFFIFVTANHRAKEFAEVDFRECWQKQSAVKQNLRQQNLRTRKHQHGLLRVRTGLALPIASRFRRDRPSNGFDPMLLSARGALAFKHRPHVGSGS